MMASAGTSCRMLGQFWGLLGHLRRHVGHVSAHVGLSLGYTGPIFTACWPHAGLYKGRSFAPKIGVKWMRCLVRLALWVRHIQIFCYRGPPRCAHLVVCWANFGACWAHLRIRWPNVGAIGRHVEIHYMTCWVFTHWVPCLPHLGICSANVEATVPHVGHILPHVGFQLDQIRRKVAFQETSRRGF